MSRKINYYFTLVSPWAYIGDALFKSIVRKHGVAVDYRPVNLGRLFPNSGGLPLGQRHRCASNTGSSNCSAGARSAASLSRSSRTTGRSILRSAIAARWRSFRQASILQASYRRHSDASSNRSADSPIAPSSQMS